MLIYKAMVSVSSLHSLSQLHPCVNPCCSLTSSSNKPSVYILKSKLNTDNSLAPSISLGGIKRYRYRHILCCSCNKYHEDEEGQEPLSLLGELRVAGSKRRREALFNMVFTAFTFPAIVSDAIAAIDVAEDFRVYNDDVNKFQISIPQGWQVGAGEPSGFKSVTAFYPEEASNSSVSVVITGLGPDFTRLESFGKVDAFAETLVGGLDRSWQRPPGVAAKLVDCKAANGFYYIEYTLQNPGESCKHLFSALGVAFNGWYNRLYTVTGQFVDEESEKYGTKIQKAVSSFRFT